jgi:hypothetical protein
MVGPAKSDWREALERGDLADADWPGKHDEELDPPK